MSTGLLPLKTTGDGNCLFNAASIALTGSENSSITFRLSGVLHAVQHFDHYKTIVSITLLSAEISPIFYIFYILYIYSTQEYWQMQDQQCSFVAWL